MTQLYNSDLSPFAGRVRVGCLYKGVPLELADPPGGLHSEAYRAITPIDKLPVMTHGDLVMPESQVILEYLDETHEGPSLLPGTAAERARARLLARLGDLYVFPPLTTLFGQLNPKYRDAAVVDAKLAELKKALGYVEHHLAGGPFAAGPAFSVADCALPTVCFFVDNFAPVFGLTEPYAEAPKLRAYLAGIAAHPAVAPILAAQTEALRKMQKR
ncbi:glutathione S-transferase family protein [Chelatococcus reniformis]|uniref:Glutathione S-transferase n=1 Tax=Chelatococcus reniformis TaxID=1494448 RepID=A0A916U7H3_9HYPH|nr:glutathione S-transferase family protein [Chelatococcus reniformis]GGC61391.1 glutathione S-transferase [Chelatococcus reniformis]